MPTKLSTHPTYKDMVEEAIREEGGRKGLSLAAIKKYVHSTHEGVNETRLKHTVQNMEENGEIHHNPSHAGTFRLGAGSHHEDTGSVSSSGGRGRGRSGSTSSTGSTSRARSKGGRKASSSKSRRTSH